MTLWGTSWGGSPLIGKLVIISLLMVTVVGQLSFKGMNGIKLLFMAMEAGLIIELAFFMWSLQEKGTIEFIEALFTFLLALGAVTFQKEQQSIEWDENTEE